MIALVTELQSKRHIGVLRLKDKTLQVVSKTPLDKTPRFSPNGRMILYATTVNRRGVLVAISSDGRARQLFKLEEGDIAEPAWSPWRLR